MRFVRSSSRFYRLQLNIFSLARTAEALHAKIRQIRSSLKGRVTLRLNIRLKRYVYRQHLYTVG